MWKRFLLLPFVYVYLQLVYHTTRWKRQGHKTIRDNAKRKKPQIFLFWHGRLALMSFYKPKGQEVRLIVSRHRDGQWVGQLMRWFGIDLLEGSSRRVGSNKDRGGRAALSGAIRALQSGKAVAITPDGPRGPRMRLGGHVIELAKMTGAEIIAMSLSTSRGILLRSWDRFFLPLPFAKGIYLVAAPVIVPEDADAKTIEQIRQHVEDSLNALTHTADRAMRRRTSPEPD